jgi:hypothetical protein
MKRLWTLVILLIVVTLVGGYVTLGFRDKASHLSQRISSSPQPALSQQSGIAKTQASNNPGWQTFIAPKYNFRIQYPPSLRLDIDGFAANNDGGIQYNDVLAISRNPVKTIVAFRPATSTYTGTVKIADIFAIIGSGQCTIDSPLDGSSTAFVNGTTFVVTNLANAASGDEMVGEMYSGSIANNCYSLGWYDFRSLPNDNSNALIINQTTQQDESFDESMRSLFMRMLKTLATMQ